MTKTTAASVNATKFDKYRVSGAPQSMHAQSEKPVARMRKKSARAGKTAAMSAISALTKPMSNAFNNERHMTKAGEILSYPYSFDQDLQDDAAQVLDKKLAKMKYEEQYRVAEIQNQ